MQGRKRLGPQQGRDEKEFPFVPRVINPLKIAEVVIFSADEMIRRSRIVIEKEIPWVHVRMVSNPAALSGTRFDNAAVLILDDVAMNLVDVDQLRQDNVDTVIVLLSFTKLIQCSPPSVALKEFSYTGKADLIFAVNHAEFAPEKIITSVVRAAEDYLNIQKRSDVQRFILLIVDDEPSWPSQFLPVLYQIIGQRAVVKITRTYEETLNFIFGLENESEIKENYRDFGYGDKVVCLITDVFFPRGNNVNADAGRDLIRLVNKYYIRIPIIIASKAKEASELADKGFVLPKGDPGSLQTLRSYIRDRTGIGDFVIYGETDRELHRLKDVREIYQLLLAADADSREAARLRSILENYGERDKFSTWFYMHSFRELGDRLRPQRVKGRRMITLLKRSLRREMLGALGTPLEVDGIKVSNLQELLNALRLATNDMIERLSHNDVISSWLDYRGYSELADRLRPVHGKTDELKDMITGVIETWITTNGIEDPARGLL